MDILERVDDEEVFKSFDWSTFFYTHLLKSLKASLQGKKEAYKLKRQKVPKQWHTTTSKATCLLFRILRWNCTQAPSYKMLQKNIFDNKNIVVKHKLKLSTQEKAFMESRIRGDDNMEMEDDESIPDINNSDINTPDHAMNNQSLEHQTYLHNCYHEENKDKQ
ncbi:Ulp1-like peptidase [Cucumis melo var. makuwa]|uniref:Ulp1-like peptidase n=1 Tax=Cucumis melo var. makuwa TaxID=1194695 RepID=A0A5A7TQW6_CUCMM|nr:Ulp1-like peptidase [Cucumis melo var. makuwa]